MEAELIQGHGGGEIHRVAPAGDQLRGTERRLDVPALAAALLALVAHDAKVALDDVDLLGGLELPLPRLEVIAAFGTDLVGGVERVHDLDHRQRALRGGAVPGVRRLLRGRLVAVAAAALFRGGAEDVLVDARELVLEAAQLEFELDGVLPLSNL